MISLEKLMILAPLQKLPKNVVNLGKTMVATGFEKLRPKSNKLPNLVTLIATYTTAGNQFMCIINNHLVFTLS